MSLPLSRSWRVGTRLRFKLDAVVKPRYRYLRGTPVLVLTALRLVGEPPGWRQWIAVFGAHYPEDQFGWALPEQLEIIPGQPDDPALQIGDESELRTRVVKLRKLDPVRML